MSDDTQPADIIVSGQDLRLRVKFFGAVVVSSLIDLAYLICLFFVLAAGKWLFDRFKELFPAQVTVVTVGEWIGLGATSLMCLCFIALDVVRTVRRIWKVMLE
jgi:hypothetical protein